MASIGSTSSSFTSIIHQDTNSQRDCDEKIDFVVGNDLTPYFFDRFHEAKETLHHGFLDTDPLRVNFFSQKKFFLVQGGCLTFSDLIEEESTYFTFSGVFSTFAQTDLSAALPSVSVIIKVNKYILENPILSNTWIKDLKKEAILLEKFQSIDSHDKFALPCILSKGPIGKHHFCIVQRDYETKLNQFIGPNHLPQFLTHVRSLLEVYDIGKQLLETLHTLSEPHLNVLHGSINPSHIILDDEVRLKTRLINFNKALFFQEGMKIGQQTNELYYTPPEVIFGLPIDKTLDVWAVGCIMFELFSGVKLFNTLEAEEMITMFTALMGPAPESFVRQISNAEFYFAPIEGLQDSFSSIYLENYPECEKQFLSHFDQYFDAAFYEMRPYQDPHFWQLALDTDEMRSLFKDFLLYIFKWNKEERPSSQQLLSHPFMEQIKDRLTDN